MNALEEDIILPRIYGPLLERGMSLREIKKHNRWEIMMMLKALERHNILTEGSQLTPEMRKENPDCAVLYASYLDELEKYKRQTGAVNGDDESD